MNIFNFFKSKKVKSVKETSVLCVFSHLKDVGLGVKLINKECDYEKPVPIIGVVYSVERALSIEHMALVMPINPCYSFSHSLYILQRETIGLSGIFKNKKYKVWFLQKDMNLITQDQAKHVQERMFEILNEAGFDVSKRRFSEPIDHYTVDSFHVKNYDTWYSKQT